MFHKAIQNEFNLMTFRSKNNRELFQIRSTENENQKKKHYYRYRID